MANILILSGWLPYPVFNGGAVRLFNMARELAVEHTCHLVAFDNNREGTEALQKSGVFKTISFLPASEGSQCIRRFFRISEENFHRYSNPRYFRSVVAKLDEMVKAHSIDVVFSAPSPFEFLRPISNVKKIVDDCDCVTLTMRRQLSALSGRMTVKEKFSQLIQLYRWRLLESKLTAYADIVTTISDVDRSVVQEISRIRKDAVIVVPNGVALESISHKINENEKARSIVFWGALEFLPNSSAVQYFYNEVFVPYLRDKGISWYIVGQNPGPEIRKLVEKEKNIIVTGYLEDLFGFVAQIPIMINPMIMGSGMKNKVLEAFALKMAVVSTTLGMEAISAVNGEHYVRADDPSAFSDAIIKLLSEKDDRIRIGKNARDLLLSDYTWKKVGDQWRGIVKSVVNGGSPNNI